MIYFCQWAKKGIKDGGAETSFYFLREKFKVLKDR